MSMGEAVWLREKDEVERRAEILAEKHSTKGLRVLNVGSKLETFEGAATILLMNKMRNGLDLRMVSLLILRF